MARRPSHRWTGLLALALGAGCAPVASDYVLRLVPITPDDQLPFAGDVAVKLLVRDASGTRIDLLGEGLSGDVEQGGQPPLEAAFAGLIVETAGGSADAHDPEHLVAYGEIGGLSLSTGGDAIEATVLVATFADVGRLGALDAGLLFGDAVVTTNGEVVFVGGAASFGGAKGATDRVLRLPDLDSGAWDAEEGAPLPLPGAGQRAIVILEGDRELVLVTGGRADVFVLGGNTPTATLIDPVTGDTVWTDPQALRTSRSQHVAVPLANGKVVLAGGFVSSDGRTPDRAPFELYDPAARAFSASPGAELAVPSIAFAAAPLGARGALFCGGGRVQSVNLTASSACSIVDLGGAVQPAASLPVAVHLLAMAPLADGRVLACGGVTGTIASAGSGPAVDTAWIYDPEADTWSVTGRMLRPRAWHRAVPTPDGRVLLVGGADAAGPLLLGAGTPETCVEIYDPAAGVFLAGGCGAVGSGSAPVVASHPLHGAIAVSGIDVDDPGEEYGVIGFGPVITP